MNGNFVVVIPIFNCESYLNDILVFFKERDYNVIVVDDGSTDNSLNIAKRFKNTTILQNDRQKGKGFSLRKAFEFIRDNLSVDFIVTIDGTGRHQPKDIDKLINKYNHNSPAVISGTRVFSTRLSIKRKSAILVSRSMLKLCTGESLKDPLSGFKVYPMGKYLFGLKRNGFEYEQELLLEAIWSGYPIVEIDLSPMADYSNRDTSALKLIGELFHIFTLYIWALIVRFIFPFSSLKVEGDGIKEKVTNIIKIELQSHTTPQRGALAIALGVFMGIFPIHGFQVMALMFLATKFKLNRPLAFLGVNISAPPFIPFLIIITLKIGSLFIPIEVDNYHLDEIIANGGTLLFAFIIGSVVLAPILALITYFTTLPILKKMKSQSA